MKKQLIILTLALACVAPAAAQRSGTSAQSGNRLAGSRDSLSFSLGYLLGSRLASEHPEGVGEIDFTVFQRAFQEAIGGGSDWIDRNKIEQYVDKYYAARRRALYAGNIEAGERFLAENGNDPEVFVTPSGLQYRIVSPGRDAGDRPRPYDDMHITYTGKLLDGTVFVSGDNEYSYPASEDADGMTEGTQLMSPGARYIFYIPADLAFGDGGREFGDGYVPPHSVVIYEVYMNSMERDHGYYDEDEDTEVDMDNWSAENGAASDTEAVVFEAGDYTATRLPNLRLEVDIDGYSSDEIVKTYQTEGFTIVATGDKAIVLDQDGNEVFRHWFDEENNNYDGHYLTEYRALDGAGPVFLVLDIGFGGGSYYGGMLYVIENGTFRQTDKYLALVNEDGGDRLTPILTLHRAEDGVEFRFDSDKIRFDPIGDTMTLSGEDFWYVYCDGQITEAGPATTLSRFRNREDFHISDTIEIVEP